MAKITLVDYGLGNIQAFVNIYQRLDVPIIIATSSEQLAGAEKIILPGVGSFDWALDLLNKSGMRDTLDEMVLGLKTPVLGVCVGMQMMAKSSEEGTSPGLGWIDAEVVRFKLENAERSFLPLPHMGWNDVQPNETSDLFQKIESPRYYFLHSFFVVPRVLSEVLATTSYGRTFASAVQKDNIYGTQFHPEKSHNWGIKLLSNFANLPLC